MPIAPVRSVSSQVDRYHGLRLDYLTANTLRLQPGAIRADNGTTLEVTSAIDWSWTDIDVGGDDDDVSTHYWLWLSTGGTTLTASKSATAPTIAGAKALVGWFYNDSAGNIHPFRSRPTGGGDLKIWWRYDGGAANARVVADTGTQVTSYASGAVDLGALGRAPSSLCSEVEIHVTHDDNFSHFFSVDGTNDWVVSTLNSTGKQLDDTAALPMEGSATYWYKLSGTSASDNTFHHVVSCTLDRSGLTYT